MIFTQPQIDQLEQYLSGTCNTFPSALEACEMSHLETNDAEAEFCERTEMEICSVCDWWADAGEWSGESGEIICNDCG